MMPFTAWLKEVVAAAGSQRVSTAMTLLVVLGSAAVVLITAGRSAGAEAAVLADIDAVGTRTVTVRISTPQDEFNATPVDQLSTYGDVIEEVTGFGPIVDVTSTSGGGTPVAMRTVYGWLAGSPVTPLAPVTGSPQALATTDAVEAMGLLAGRGSIVDSQGTESLVSGRIVLPEHLSSIEPVVLVPRETNSTARLSMLTVVADQPANLPLVTELVTDSLSGIDPGNLTLGTSEQLAELRVALDGQLTRQSHSLVLGILIASAFAILVNVWSLSLMRRKDFGRRRALECDEDHDHGPDERASCPGLSCRSRRGHCGGSGSPCSNRRPAAYIHLPVRRCVRFHCDGDHGSGRARQLGS
ncbi:hypothetical protein [Nocardioides sp. B-3]|uniref:hypothetical protein n=1 Tax=Nocardioides sp. B-3 TaxID=2895565 RepID=UPI00215304AC|nr:hypothetical protein [Nocardioides sp. B-3]UUZ60896.1 hypothetical protein LP418_09355 [Nocardioides sp. B-3]